MKSRLHTEYVMGFTYIELLVVVALLGIILSFGVVMSYSSLSRASVLAERDLFVTLLLRGARAGALANVHESSHGIHIDNNSQEYVLFEGTEYDAGNASNRSTKFTNPGIRIENATNDDTYDIIFEQLSGNVSEGAGTITVKNANAEQNILVSEVGQIDW